ncbi:MAG TPA: hypothetical protein VGM94_08535 [Galbitalea sp.]|jgi:hypothetical protein
MNRYTSLLLAFSIAACAAPGSASTSPTAALPAPSPTDAAPSQTAVSCIILSQSRFIDDPTPIVLETEGVSAAKCAATVAQDNLQDDWAKAHPEVVLDTAPAGTPLCSIVVAWPGESAARETVWGNGIFGRNFCFTLRYVASQTQQP